MTRPRRVRAALALAGLAALAGAAAAGAQELALTATPGDVAFTARAADEVLASGADGQVSLESFAGETATGVYLHGLLRGAPESIGYGKDAAGRRYLWLSIPRGAVELVAMLYDVDLDLTPDYLLFRMVDPARREERLTEYRSPAAEDAPLDISVQAACSPPRCDPATWTVHERERTLVPTSWFAPWRPIMALAAARGERWIGRPTGTLPVRGTP